MPFSLRMKDWLKRQVESCMKRYNLKSMSEGLHRLVHEKDGKIKTLKTELEKQRVAFMAQGEMKAATTPKKFSQCWGHWFIIEGPTNLRRCLNPKPLVNLKHFDKTGLIPECCEVCNKEYKKLKQLEEELRLYGKIVSSFEETTGRKRISKAHIIVAMNKQIETLQTEKIDLRTLFEKKLSTRTAQRDTARTRLNALKQDYVGLEGKLKEYETLDQRFAEKKHLLNDIKAFESLKQEHEILKAQNANIDTLKSKVSVLKKTLSLRDKKIASLEVDNEEFRLKVEKLSESPLLRENDNLHIQLKQNDKLFDEYKLEIRKLQALVDEERKVKVDVIAHVSQMLRDFKQYAPSKLEPWEAMSYLRSVRKTIQNFEGYLETIEPTTASL